MSGNSGTDKGIPEQWCITTLADLFLDPKSEIVDGPFGSNLKASEYMDSGVPILRIQNIERNLFINKNIKHITPQKAEKLERHCYRPGDVILTKLGDPLGKSCIIPESFPAGIVVADLVRLRLSHENINKKFLVYAINSSPIADQLKKLTKGTTRPRVNLGHIRSLKLKLPPKAEQHRIVTKIEELFSELDKGTESLKAARAKLNIYRQAVLKHAFEGKLTAQWREENKDKLETPEQLLSRIKQEREARYEQQLQEWKAAVKTLGAMCKSDRKPTTPKRPTEVVPIKGELRGELPATPACWEWLNLKHVGRVETGTTPSTKIPENYGGKLPFFKPTDLDQGAHVRTARDYLSPLGEECARVLPAGSTLVTCIGATIGKTGFAVTRCATNQQINSISPCAGFDPKFVYLQMVAPFLNERVRADASATTLPILNKSKFSELPFVLCSLPEQRELIKLVEERFVAMERSEREIALALNQAEMLRQSILKKAFTGQLVPQDPRDEPASVLLNRIKTEREKAVQNNHSKKTRKKRKTTA